MIEDRQQNHQQSSLQKMVNDSKKTNETTSKLFDKNVITNLLVDNAEKEPEQVDPIHDDDVDDDNGYQEESGVNKHNKKPLSNKGNFQNNERPFKNYFSFIKKSALNKGSFEINGRHNECISCKNNVFYVKNLKFPDCVVRNLCQTYKYQGELWFKPPHNTDESQCYETIYEKIHVELNDFYCFIKPLKEDEILRKATFFCISDSIKQLPFVKQVKYYGSYSSKTYLPVSDIDLVVYCNMIYDEITLLIKIAEKLSLDGIIENKFNIVPMSKIPLLKFNDSLTGLPINITINTPNVMERSQYLKKNITYNSHQMKILFFLKYYLLSKGTNQVFYGGIGSYSLALMVIRFFQEESVKELIRSEHVFQNSILGYLLMGFLERFGDVNFFKNHIISVQDEGDYIQCDYDYGRHSNPDKKSSVLRIKDHIEPWNDVSYGSFNSAEILKDFQFLHNKFMKADKSKDKSLLGQVLYVVDSFVEYRNLLLYLFRKWFDDYDVKEYMSGRYPSRNKYQEFIDKRRIFQKKSLKFIYSNLEDKSIDFIIEPIHTSRPGLTFYFNNNQEHEDRFEIDNRNSYRAIYDHNRIGNYNHHHHHHVPNQNGLYLAQIDRCLSNKIQINPRGEQTTPFYFNNVASPKRNKRSKTITNYSSTSSPTEKIAMDFNHEYPRLNGDKNSDRSRFTSDSNSFTFEIHGR